VLGRAGRGVLEVGGGVDAAGVVAGTRQAWRRAGGGDAARRGGGDAACVGPGRASERVRERDRNGRWWRYVKLLCRVPVIWHSAKKFLSTSPSVHRVTLGKDLFIF
jgi:hypothetical protein